MAINLKDPSILLGIFILAVFMYVFYLKKKKSSNQEYSNVVGGVPPSPGVPPAEPAEEGFDLRPHINNPEGYVETINNLGDTLKINQMKTVQESLTNEGVSVLTKESTVEQLCRSMWDADFDGPQMEGMTAPVDEFENTAMVLQNAKSRDLYIDYKSQSADQLSDSNI